MTLELRDVLLGRARALGEEGLEVSTIVGKVRETGLQQPTHGRLHLPCLCRRHGGRTGNYSGQLVIVNTEEDLERGEGDRSPKGGVADLCKGRREEKSSGVAIDPDSARVQRVEDEEPGPSDDGDEGENGNNQDDIEVPGPRALGHWNFCGVVVHGARGRE